MRAAVKHAPPIVVDGREKVEAGGLVSFGINKSEHARRFAALLDKTLRGALGLTISQSLLLRSNEPMTPSKPFALPSPV